MRGEVDDAVARDRVTHASWNRACAAIDATIPGFDSGAVTHTDDHGNVLRVQLTACGAWTGTLDGNPI